MSHNVICLNTHLYVHYCPLKTVTIPQGDIAAGQMLQNVRGVSAERRERLIEVLDIEPSWRLHQVSDGQRRRVQIAMGLLHEFKVGSGVGGWGACVCIVLRWRVLWISATIFLAGGKSTIRSFFSTRSRWIWTCWLDPVCWTFSRRRQRRGDALSSMYAFAISNGPAH